MARKFLINPKTIGILSLAFAGTVVGLNPTSIGQQNRDLPEEVQEKKNKSPSDRYVARYSKDLQYLASDELGGRDTATPGAEKSIQYIISEFKKYGIKSAVDDGSYRQPFEVQLGVSLDKSSTMLSFKKDGQEKQLKFKDEFYPQKVGGSADVSGGLAFVGYGIEDQTKGYNDYENIDVEGKIVVMMGTQPKFGDEDSYYGKGSVRTSSYVRRKVRWAKVNKAVGIIFVRHTSNKDSDTSISSSQTFGGYNRKVPFVQITRSIFNQMLSMHPLKTDKGEKLDSQQAVIDYINKHGKPVSQVIEGVSCSYKANFARKTGFGYNVCGMIEGEGPLANETIVIGAHYDHLGIGNVGARDRKRIGEIHNGADDNATGTVAVMEIARRIAESGKKPARRLVFVGFSGEERGLIGSKHYCEKPLFPLENTVAMINFDMIGWLRSGGLTVRGIATCKAWPACVEKAHEGMDLKLDLQDSPFSGSDHMSFLAKKKAVVTFHTGQTPTYHTPDDDFETINVEGASKVVDFAHKLVLAVDQTEEFKYQNPSGGRKRLSYLGASLDFNRVSENGIKVVDLNEDSPASKGGLKKGDILDKLGEKKIRNRNNVSGFLQKNKPGTVVEATIHRDGKTMKLKIKLGKK